VGVREMPIFTAEVAGLGLGFLGMSL
jgi:hypothetical protein